VVNGKQFLEYHHLFERYGDVVRTGPNHLMVRNASAVSTVLGARNQWLKNGRACRHDAPAQPTHELTGRAGYTVARPDHSYELITIVDPAEHSRRRRIWEPAFTPTAIKSYAAPLRTRVEQLSAQLSARLGTPLDIAEWLGFLTIDFMGDFAFGSLFNLITDGADHRGIHKHGVDGLRGVEVLGTIPWIRPLVLARPNPSIKKRFAVALGVVEKRQQERSERRDLSYYLVRPALAPLHRIPLTRAQMNEGGKGPHPGMTTETLAREGMLALFAGADTTSTTMAGVLFYLMTHPACFRRLRAELDGAAGDGAPYNVPIEGDALVGLKYLDAVINETLRLQPAVPSGVQRVPPRDSGPVLVVGQYVSRHPVTGYDTE
jgi:cytochrome P450